MILTLLRSATFCFAAATTLAAVAQTDSSYTTDPYNVPSPAYVSPGGNASTMWQTDPFGVGYNMLSGFRQIYAGARQPMGHEIIPTRADGNGYVYRPVYAASPGYHYTRGGALIVEFPQQHPTLADTPFPTWPIANGYGATGVYGATNPYGATITPPHTYGPVVPLIAVPQLTAPLSVAPCPPEAAPVPRTREF